MGTPLWRGVCREHHLQKEAASLFRNAGWKGSGLLFLSGSSLRVWGLFYVDWSNRRERTRVRGRKKVKNSIDDVDEKQWGSQQWRTKTVRCAPVPTQMHGDFVPGGVWREDYLLSGFSGLTAVFCSSHVYHGGTRSIGWPCSHLQCV